MSFFDDDDDFGNSDMPPLKGDDGLVDEYQNLSDNNEEEDYDAFNEETFAGDLGGDGEDWEAEHDKLILLEGNEDAATANDGTSTGGGGLDRTLTKIDDINEEEEYNQSDIVEQKQEFNKSSLTPQQQQKNQQQQQQLKSLQSQFQLQHLLQMQMNGQLGSSFNPEKIQQLLQYQQQQQMQQQNELQQLIVEQQRLVMLQNELKAKLILQQQQQSANASNTIENSDHFKLLQQVQYQIMQKHQKYQMLMQQQLLNQQLQKNSAQQFQQQQQMPTLPPQAQPSSAVESLMLAATATSSQSQQAAQSNSQNSKIPINLNNLLGNAGNLNSNNSKNTGLTSNSVASNQSMQSLLNSMHQQQQQQANNGSQSFDTNKLNDLMEKFGQINLASLQAQQLHQHQQQLHMKPQPQQQQSNSSSKTTTPTPSQQAAGGNAINNQHLINLMQQQQKSGIQDQIDKMPSSQAKMPNVKTLEEIENELLNQSSAVSNQKPSKNTTENGMKNGNNILNSLINPPSQMDKSNNELRNGNNNLSKLFGSTLNSNQQQQQQNQMPIPSFNNFTQAQQIEFMKYLSAFLSNNNNMLPNEQQQKQLLQLFAYQQSVLQQQQQQQLLLQQQQQQQKTMNNDQAFNIQQQQMQLTALLASGLNQQNNLNDSVTQFSTNNSMAGNQNFNANSNVYMNFIANFQNLNPQQKQFLMSQMPENFHSSIFFQQQQLLINRDLEKNSNNNNKENVNQTNSASNGDVMDNYLNNENNNSNSSNNFYDSNYNHNNSNNMNNRRNQNYNNRRNDNYGNNDNQRHRNNNQRFGNNQRNSNYNIGSNISINTGDKLAGMMTEKEKNWVVNVQMLQLQIDDPYSLDFYYTAWNLKKKQFSMQNSNAAALKTSVLFQSTNRHDPKNYKPLTFENSLGKVTMSNFHHPRALIDINKTGDQAQQSNNTLATHIDGLDDDDEDGNKKEKKNICTILLEIEKMYQVYLNIDEIEHKILKAPEELRASLFQDRRAKVDKLASMMCSENFAHYLFVPKGKRLLGKCIPTFNIHQTKQILGFFMQYIYIISKNNISLDEIYSQLSYAIDTQKFNDLVDIVHQFVHLYSNQSNQLYHVIFSNKFGLTYLLKFFSKSDLVSQDDYDIDVKATWSSYLNLILTGLTTVQPTLMSSDGLDLDWNIAESCQFNPKLALENFTINMDLWTSNEKKLKKLFVYVNDD